MMHMRMVPVYYLTCDKDACTNTLGAGEEYDRSTLNSEAFNRCWTAINPGEGRVLHYCEDHTPHCEHHNEQCGWEPMWVADDGYTCKDPEGIAT